MKKDLIYILFAETVADIPQSPHGIIIILVTLMQMQRLKILLEVENGILTRPTNTTKCPEIKSRLCGTINATLPRAQEPKCITILNAITINNPFQMTVLNINILSGLYLISRILNHIAQNGWFITKNLKYLAQLIWSLKIPMVRFKSMIGNDAKKFNTKLRSVNMQ